MILFHLRAGGGGGGTWDDAQGGRSGRDIHRDVIAAENAEMASLYAAGTISAATRQRLQHGLDLELAPARQRNGLTAGSSPGHCCSCRSWHWSGCGLASLQVCREAWSAVFMILQLAGLEAHNGAGHKPAHRRH
jgi:hypothetical protein